MLSKIILSILQTVLRLHRQHDGKLNHHVANLALWVTQDAGNEMLHINRIGKWTLFSLLAQGTAVTTKTPEKNQTTDK
jgi:hypothetical protein